MALNRVYAQDQVNIKSKFVDVKKRLADVSREEWEALPDA
jgi:PRP1 splicing factor, N-terminal